MHIRKNVKESNLLVFYKIDSFFVVHYSNASKNFLFKLLIIDTGIQIKEIVRKFIRKTKGSATMHIFSLEIFSK